MDRLHALVVEGRRAWLDGEAADAVARFEAARTLLPALLAAVGERAQALAATTPSDRVAGRLPAFRRPWMLVVDPPGDDAVAAELAEALEIDLATARLVALARYPAVALRGDDAASLDRQAARVRASLGLRAVVAGREELLGLPPPQVVVAAGPGQVMRATPEPLWTAEPDPARRPVGASVPAQDVRLAVPGEVAIHRLRKVTSPRSGGGPEQHPAGERRVGVVDLHGPGLYLRVVEGITDTTGLPGHQPGSARRSIRAFGEQVHARWPAVRVVGPRLCRPLDRPTAGPAPEADPTEVSGWPAWEEHSRVCRLVALTCW